MLHSDLFSELAGNNEGYFIDNPNDDLSVLKALKDKFSLNHIAYLGINLPIKSDSSTYIMTTYSSEWVERYVTQNYVKIDPVINYGFQGIMPIDWKSLPKNSKKVVQLFAEAKEHGLGNQGLSIPIRGVHGETAMFSVNVDMSDKDWLHFRKQIIRELQIHAYNFHTKILENNGVQNFKKISLSDREKECLLWASKGKTAWEIASILGIKTTTVNFFLEHSRSKLDVLNTTQAVAKAIRYALI